MKKLLILSFAAIVTFTACEDFLVQEPTLSNITEIQLSDYSGLDMATAGAYAPLSGLSWYGANFILNSELRSGNAQRPSVTQFTSGRLTIPYFLHYDESSTEGLWGMGYYAISAANNVLEVIETKGPELINLTYTQKMFDNLKAECLFIRAIAHFDMLRLYCKPTKLDLGIPIVLKTDKTLSEQPARNTVAEVFDQIEQDLIQASELIDPKYRRAGMIDPTASISLNAIKALMARVYLYQSSWGVKNNYQLAADCATWVIKNSGCNMWKADEYTKVWGVEAFDPKGEVIFSVYDNKSNSYNAWWDGPSHMTNPNGYADCAASPDLTDLFTDGDIRGSKGVRDGNKDDGKVMFCTDVDGASNGQLWTMKYYGKGVGDAKNSPDFNNIIILRLSEMYLIRAEAQLNGATGSNALDDINTIRANRGVEPATSASNASLALERRLELNFEGHLWFDLARTTRTITYGDAKLRHRDGIAEDSPLWALPLPLRELNVNSNLVQNDLE